MFLRKNIFGKFKLAFCKTEVKFKVVVIVLENFDYFNREHD